MIFPHGLPLSPYPVLRKTLSQLKPSIEFFANLEEIAGGGKPENMALFVTGDEKSTTQYLIAGQVDSGTVLSVSIAIDPYVELLSPYRKEYLQRLQAGKATGPGTRLSGAGTVDKSPFTALQQFARGETALLAYCGHRDDALAAHAYQAAVTQGLMSQQRLAEAYHKLGLSFRGQGRLQQARHALEQSLTIQPNRPDVMNNLGTILDRLGEKENALTLFRKAVSLQPDYPVARYNLAEAYEDIDRKRAVEEYETYLALAEEIPGEHERYTQATQRVKILTR